MALSKPVEDKQTGEYEEVLQAEALRLFERWRSIGHLFRFLEDETNRLSYRGQRHALTVGGGPR
jgi:hypothetical protein